MFAKHSDPQMKCAMCIQCNIIADKQRLFLIPATTNFWCFFNHKSNQMRMPRKGHAKVQLSHYLSFRSSRCLRNRSAQKTEALSGKLSWLLETNFYRLSDLKVTSNTCPGREFLSQPFQPMLGEPRDWPCIPSIECSPLTEREKIEEENNILGYFSCKQISIHQDDKCVWVTRVKIMWYLVLWHNCSWKSSAYVLSASRKGWFIALNLSASLKLQIPIWGDIGFSLLWVRQLDVEAIVHTNDMLKS